MKRKQTHIFSATVVGYYLDAKFLQLKKLVATQEAIVITDENIFKQHAKKFKPWNTIVLKAGEKYKVQSTVDSVIRQLIALKADKKTTLVGVGGGVITDLTGFIASIYQRGINFGFVPTSLLAMVDAAIGGKNGIDVDGYKNMVGTIRQPKFVLVDIDFLSSLPQSEWKNGFAEIIKHACIKDSVMFQQLQNNSLEKYQQNKNLLLALIQRNVILKTKIVLQDEFEIGERRLLNFGHTLGHALEKEYEISHGQAISIGMSFAAHLSEQQTGFKDTTKLRNLLLKYQLSVDAAFDKKKMVTAMSHDKKREQSSIHFIVLEKIGKATVVKIPIRQFEKLIK